MMGMNQEQQAECVSEWVAPWSRLVGAWHSKIPFRQKWAQHIQPVLFCEQLLV